MHASAGDKLVIRRTGEQDRVVLEIIEVLGPEGEPPYRVRTQDGHEVVMSPGPDAVVQPGGMGDY